MSRLELVPGRGRLYTGITLPHVAKGYVATGIERRNLPVRWTSSDPSVARVDRFGNVTGVRPGTATIVAEVEGARAEQRYVVARNPVTRIELGIKESSVRTGDVVHLLGTPQRADGTPAPNAPIT